MSPLSLVIHAGAGNSDPDPASEKARLDALHRVLAEGFAVLDRGGSALDAVTRAVIALEDFPLFNAGKGAVLAASGEAELDACIIDGHTRACGGISAVKTVKNPVLAARAVMERSPHSLLCGGGAENFARDCGLEMVGNDYFIMPERQQALEDALQKKKFEAGKGLGTVGACAFDSHGRLAAATSTGGLTGKMPGRVSDSSIAGAGTWAADGVCALSCTGTGDVFIRNATGRDIACLIEYKGLSLDAAIRRGLDNVAAGGGCGGIIGIAPDGHVVMDWNTKTMARGFVTTGSAPFAAVD